MSNVFCIGTDSYKQRMLIHKQRLENNGHNVRLPAFDDIQDLDSLGVCNYNKQQIEWADEVHIFWNQRSVGTIFDFGMCFMLNKPIKIIYLEPKTFRKVMESYERIVV